MERKTVLLAVILLISSTSFSQKLVKTYYDYGNTKVHEQYYVNAKGEKDGAYTEYAENGIITGQASFHNGLANGVVTIYSTETGRQVLLKKETYVEGKKNGPATYYDDVNDASIVTSTGTYKDDAKEGTWTFIEPVSAQDYNYPNPEIPQQVWNGCNHVKYIAKYSNDEKIKYNGKHIETFYPSGKVYDEGTFVHGIPIEAFMYYPNGKIFTYTKDDSITGNSLVFKSWQYPGTSKDSIPFYIKAEISKAHSKDSANKILAMQNFIKNKREADSLSNDPNHPYNSYASALVDYTDILHYTTFTLSSTMKDSINNVINEITFLHGYGANIGNNDGFSAKYNQFYTVYTGNNGSYNTYPHGSHLFEKTDKLLKQLFSEANGQVSLNERYKKATLIMTILDKLISLANSDTKDLDKQMKKAETTEDVRQLLGL